MIFESSNKVIDTEKRNRRVSKFALFKCHKFFLIEHNVDGQIIGMELQQKRDKWDGQNLIMFLRRCLH